MKTLGEYHYFGTRKNIAEIAKKIKENLKEFYSSDEAVTHIPYGIKNEKGEYEHFNCPCIGFISLEDFDANEEEPGDAIEKAIKAKIEELRNELDEAEKDYGNYKAWKRKYSESI